MRTRHAGRFPDKTSFFVCLPGGWLARAAHEMAILVCILRRLLSFPILRAGSKMHRLAPLWELGTYGKVACSSHHHSPLLAQLKPLAGFSSHWVLLCKAASLSSFGSSTSLNQNQRGSTKHYCSLRAWSSNISSSFFNLPSVTTMGHYSHTMQCLETWGVRGTKKEELLRAGHVF